MDKSCISNKTRIDKSDTLEKNMTFIKNTPYFQKNVVWRDSL